MNYLFSENELNIARKLTHSIPKGIWYDFNNYTLDFGEYYIEIQSVDREASTQNKSDEVIISRLIEIKGSYKPGPYSILVCEKQIIEEVYIVRVFVYFSTNEIYSKNKIRSKKLIYRIKEFFGYGDPIDKLIAETTGGHEEFTCHPDWEGIKDISPEYSSLADCGLLFKINGQYLKAFAESNGYGYHIWDNKYFHGDDEFYEIGCDNKLILLNEPKTS